MSGLPTAGLTNGGLPLVGEGLPIAPVLNTVGNVLSALPTGDILEDGVRLNLENLPVGQVLNTVTNVAESLPIIGAPTVDLRLPQIGVPINPQPLLSTLASTTLNTASNLLSEPLSGLPAFNVDSTLNRILNKVYNLQGGYIEIEFDLRVISSLLPVGASLLVTLDNNPIYRVLASQVGRVRIPIPTRILRGVHSIGFLPLRGSVTSFFSFLVSGLIVYEKQLLNQLTNNLLNNGGFEVNGCLNNFCLWNAQNLVAGAAAIVGWVPVPQLEVVRAALLNPVLGNGWAVELDATSNTCITQTLSLRQGRHLLSFDWAARALSPLASNGILVLLNRQLLRAIAPADYALHTEALDFYVSTNGGAVELALCGAGTSDGIGALIDNIRIALYDETFFRINTYNEDD